MNRLVVLCGFLVVSLASASCGPPPRPDDPDDDDDQVGDDDDDQVGDDDDQVGDDDDQIGDDDDQVGDDDDQVGDDDDQVGDDDDQVGDDDDTTSQDIPAGALLFSEVMYNPAAVNDADGEWFELVNTTGTTHDLGGCTISDDTGDSYSVSSLSVPGGSYVVFGVSANLGDNGGIPVDQSHGGAINLRNSDPDQLILTCSVVVDRIEWAPGWPGGSGIAMSFDEAESPLNDDPDHWCDATATLGSGDRGTPGAANGPCGGGGQVPGPDDLVFTEVIQNPSVVDDSDGEWFEMVNRTGNSLDLAGCTLSDLDSDSHTITALSVPANGRVVFGTNPDFGTNGNVVVDYDYGSSLTLGNGADELVLDCAGQIDRIEWTGSAPWPDPTGASMSLSEGSLLANHVGANWCVASSSYGAGDLGTPGDVNDPC
jgi:uncharacterized protein